MAKYVLLLRGINVGGKNKVPMAELRELLTDEIGCTDVQTYIASGNAIVSSSLSAAKLQEAVEQALPKRFRLDTELLKVLVLTRPKLKAVVANKPAGFGEQPDTFHSDAIFLMNGLTAAKAFQVFVPRDGVDRVWKGTGVIYSQRLSAERTKSKLGEIVGTDAYADMTIRSWNTTVKLGELLG